MTNLNNLYRGDKIAVKASNRYDPLPYYSIHTITADTKTQVKVGERRFRRSDGYEIGSRSGSGWNFSERNAVPVTAEILEANAKYEAEKRRQGLAEILRDRCHKLDLETLEAMVAMLPEESEDE